jgi:hypothetical protein
MILNGFDVCSQIKQPAHSCDDSWQQPNVREPDANRKTLSIGNMVHLDAPHGSIDLDCAQVAGILHDLNARHCPGAQEREHTVPVIRRTVAKPQRDVLLYGTGSPLSPQGAGRAMEEIEKRFIESPQTAKTGCHGDLHHRHSSFMNQLLRE